MRSARTRIRTAVFPPEVARDARIVLQLRLVVAGLAVAVLIALASIAMRIGDAPQAALPHLSAG